MTSHFIDDEKLRARFWGAVGDLCVAAGLKRGESNATAHAALHVDSVREWAGDPEADAGQNLTAALKVVATYLTVSEPDQRERIENVARAFDAPRLGAVGARRIGGDMTPEEIEAKLAESKKKPLFSSPQAPATPPNPASGGEVAGAQEKPQETPESAHWATDEAKVDTVLAALREIGVNVAEARAANGLAPEQPLTDFRGTGRGFLAAARAWREAQAQASKPQPVPPATTSAAKADEIMPRPLVIRVTTLTGLPLDDLPDYMNMPFPPAAYHPIPKGLMAGKTDVKFDYVRDRFDAAFGPHGFGWRIEPHATLGRTEYVAVETTTQKGDVRLVHMVAIENFVLRYRVVMPDGTLEWAETGPLSDCDGNEDRGYAYRGAWTSLLKQFLRALGGLNHIYRNEYTHREAARDKQNGS